LRTKCYSALLAIVLILASGCRKQNAAISSLEQSDTNESFDTAQAMKMLYGSYDVKEEMSVALLPKYKGFSPAGGDEQMIVRPVFKGFSRNAGEQIFVLVTYAVPADYACHACVPIIGMAVFAHKGRRWTMDAYNRAATYLGEWGKPPADIQLVQIGPNRHAVQVIDASGGQGESTSLLQLLIPWNETVNLGLERIVSDGYVCGEEDGVCHAMRISALSDSSPMGRSSITALNWNSQGLTSRKLPAPQRKHEKCMASRLSSSRTGSTSKSRVKAT